MLRAVCEYDLFKESRVVYIPFGLNFDIFYPRNKKKIFDRLGIDRRSKVVMVRGDGGHRKGIDYINEALQYLAVNGVRVHLIIVGGNEISVPEGFTYEYYGWLKDDNMLADLYSISDVYLMPSSRENFGMMAIEAMACGAIPVVIEGTALPETVNAPHCGIATPRDKDKYSHAVHRILRNDNERFDRSKASIEYVRKKHDMDRYLNALDSEYRRAINNFDNNAGYYSAEELIAEIKKNNEIAPALNPAIAPVPSPEINDISDNSVDVGYIGWIDIYVIIYNELTVKIDSNIKERGLSFTLAQSITKIGRIGVRLTKINYIKIIAITIASIFNEGFPKTNNKAKKKIISVVKKI